MTLREDLPDIANEWVSLSVTLRDRPNSLFNDKDFIKISNLMWRCFEAGKQKFAKKLLAEFGEDESFCYLTEILEKEIAKGKG
jgi:hypothetical protein